MSPRAPHRSYPTPAAQMPPWRGMLGTIVIEHLQNWRSAMGSTKATALAVGAVWLGLGVTVAWSQTTGPITKEVATAAKAKTVTPTDCVTGCKKLGRVKSETVPQSGARRGNAIAALKAPTA